jgi:hypothetical protein
VTLAGTRPFLQPLLSRFSAVSRPKWTKNWVLMIPPSKKEGNVWSSVLPNCIILECIPGCI